MKRTRITVFLRTVAALAVLSAPALALPEAASAGWTWDENAAAWVSDESADAPATQPSPSNDAAATQQSP